MKNFMVRFFVSLCIFLLTGYGQLYAQLYLSYQQTSSTQRSESTAQKHADETAGRSSSFDKHVSVGIENPGCQFTIPVFEKAEDNDLSAFKKQLENISFSSFILSYITAGLISPAKNTLYPDRVFSYPVCNRYLVLQVFRI